MKHFSLLALLAIAVSVSCGTTRQTSEQKSAEEARTSQSIEKMLADRSFQIDVYYMIPFRGGSKSVTTYSITVDGSTIDSHLPFVGDAQNIPYGGGKGLNFKEEIASYTDEGVKKDCHTIVINVKNEEDTYVYTLGIFNNGEVSIHVNSRNRDNISYLGRIVMDYKK